MTTSKILYRVNCACGWHSRWYADGNLCWVYAERHEDRNARPDGSLRYGHRINPNFEEKRPHPTPAEAWAAAKRHATGPRGDWQF